MPRSRLILEMLASAFLAGELTAEQILQRSARMLGREWKWLRPVAQRFVSATVGEVRPRQRDVVEFLQRDKTFWRNFLKHKHEIEIEHWVAGPEEMRPIPAAATWELPRIETTGELAKWLEVTPSELEWFADLKGFDSRREPSGMSHYSYRVLTKKSGTIRLIEAPKSRMKAIQRRILADILEKIPPHPAAYGFVRGRSITSFVSEHVNRRVVLKMDLRNFFPSFRAARIQTFFRTLGYPEAVADMLGGICTNATPRSVFRQRPVDVNPADWREARDVYMRPHLPQGAPTSPAIANACCYRLDCRLTGLARAAGANYSRYADDLAFSGDRDFESRVERFSTHVAAIAMEEGFEVNFRKTRVMRQGVRQRLAGVVVNEHVNFRRSDFDQLKAILTNCLRRGAASQNRESHPMFREHMEGRVGFVESLNPEKGRRLRTMLEQIDWE